MQVNNHKNGRENPRAKLIVTLLLHIMFVLVCIALYSCGGSSQRGEGKEMEVTSNPVDVIGEESHGDSVTSEYLKEMIHSGRSVLLNFCYCCDCKVTKPMLQTVIEDLSTPVAMITIDVKKNFDLADEYGVRQSPFYMLFNERGQLVDTLYGFLGNDLMGSENIQQRLKENIHETGGE